MRERQDRVNQRRRAGIPGSACPGGRDQPGPSLRDLNLELALIDRRDPTGAAAIRSRADAEARAAHDKAIEYGPTCDL